MYFTTYLVWHYQKCFDIKINIIWNLADKSKFVFAIINFFNGKA